MPSLPSLRTTRKTEQPLRPIHVPAARAIVDCGVYLDGERLPGRFTHSQAHERVRELNAEGGTADAPRAFVWVGLHEPDLHQMNSVATTFDLHNLAVEDAVHAHQRPKIERYDNTLFFVIKTVNYVEHDTIASAREIVETGEIMIFAGPDFVVTVRHGDHSGLAGVRRAMQSDRNHLKLGPQAVLHAITDHVVDSYLAVTDAIEQDIDLMEEAVFSPTGKIEIEQIYLLKREVVELRRAIAPLSVALKQAQAFTDLVPKEVRRYMRDVADHHTIVAERVAAYDEVLSSLVNAALGKIGVQQNTDMRKISAWVAMASVPTMLAGIYGMNFEHMPELSWTFGYPLILCVMAGVSGFLYRTFRRNHWL